MHDFIKFNRANPTRFVSEGFLHYKVIKHLNAGIAMSSSEEQKSGQIKVIKMV